MGVGAVWATFARGRWELKSGKIRPCYFSCDTYSIWYGYCAGQYQTGGWQNRLRRCSVSGTCFLKITLERTATRGRDQWRDPARMFDSLGATATGFWLPLSAAEGAKGRRTGDYDMNEYTRHIGKLPSIRSCLAPLQGGGAIRCKPFPDYRKTAKERFCWVFHASVESETEIARIGGA